jgi:electron transfer flavoprotein alpha subunit
MGNIAVFVETKDKEIKKSVFGAVTAVRGDGNELFGIVLDGNAESYKESLQEYGISKVVALSADSPTEEYDPEVFAGAIADAMKALDIKVIAGVTSAIGKDLLPRLAAALNAACVLDCVAVDLAEQTVVKSNYSRKTLAKVKLSGEFFVYGIRPNSISAEPAPVTAEVIEHKAAVQNSGKLVIKEVKASTSKGVDLTEAEIIISGGRAMSSADNFKILNDCAEALGAAVGASRAAVDADFAPMSIQVGQTGKTVGPKLYIACGISGAIQHLAGMKTSKVIVAINKDDQAPIFKKCDYGIVGDLFEIVPALTEAVKNIG